MTDQADHPSLKECLSLLAQSTNNPSAPCDSEGSRHSFQSCAAHFSGFEFVLLDGYENKDEETHGHD